MGRRSLTYIFEEEKGRRAAAKLLTRDEAPEDCGLGPDLVEMPRQAAGYLDQIMHGAKPADLPLKEPDRFDLYLNLRTAAVLGLTIPSTLLATANEVIE
jgi:hypothetical protein